MFIYLLSGAGSSLYLKFAINRNDVEEIGRIDDGSYSEQDLIEIKIPIRVSYYSSTPGYERYYGEIEKDGRFYNYVKRCVQKDTVYLLCLPNKKKDRLTKIKSGLIAKEIGKENLPGTKDVGGGTKKMDFPTECCQQLSGCNFEKDFSCVTAWNVILKMGLYSCFIEPGDKPPCGSVS